MPEIIWQLSQQVKLAAGDIIMTGTPAGVSQLQPGDKIECGVDGVGTLKVNDRQAGIAEFKAIAKRKAPDQIRGFFNCRAAGWSVSHAVDHRPGHAPSGCKIRKTDTDFDYCRRITANVRAEEMAMIKVSVMYPNTPGGRFDHDYYRDKHMPLVKARMGDACKSYTVDKGMAGGAPGAPATYVGMCHIFCNSVEAFQSGFGPHAQEIMADIANYTDQSPVIQISEVVVG